MPIDDVLARLRTDDPRRLRAAAGLINGLMMARESVTGNLWFRAEDVARLIEMLDLAFSEPMPIEYASDRQQQPRPPRPPATQQPARDLDEQEPLNATPADR